MNADKKSDTSKSLTESEATFGRSRCHRFFWASPVVEFMTDIRSGFAEPKQGNRMGLVLGGL